MSNHSTPADGSSCMCCWDDLDESSYVEYRSSSDGPWKPSGYCMNCIQQLIKTQWLAYKTSLEKTNCKAEQRRLLSRGPPVNLSDAKALPCPESDNGEVHSLWFMSDGEEHSAKLEGSLIGEVRSFRRQFEGVFIRST
jgi:hypothetical protein